MNNNFLLRVPIFFFSESSNSKRQQLQNEHWAFCSWPFPHWGFLMVGVTQLTLSCWCLASSTVPPSLFYCRLACASKTILTLSTTKGPLTHPCLLPCKGSSPHLHKYHMITPLEVGHHGNRKALSSTQDSYRAPLLAVVFLVEEVY